MNIQRIYAIILRHSIPTFRDAMRIADAFYWPLIDITMFGFIAIWTQEKMLSSSFMIGLLTCIACWYLVQRSGLEIGRNLLIEIWDGNLTNLFATPLSLSELMAALMSLGFIQAIVTFVYSLTIIWIFYAQNVFLIIPSLLPFIILFICSGWIIGFIVASIIFLFGRTIDTFAWAVLWFFAIICGAFNPVKFYPLWLQQISYLLPLTYLFEGVREMILYNNSPTPYLRTASVLTIIYFVLTYGLLTWAFSKSRKKGLAQLTS